MAVCRRRPLYSNNCRSQRIFQQGSPVHGAFSNRSLKGSLLLSYRFLFGLDHPFILPHGWVIQSFLIVIIPATTFIKLSLHFYPRLNPQLTQGDFS
ncbi:MAG: hypothetical protein ACXAEU_04105 [Candidatus Hodarchaeales archaeon]